MTGLPNCNDCGASEWQQFYSFDPEREDPTDRSVTKYYCEGCDAEGRVFDGPGSVILSGAFR